MAKPAITNEALIDIQKRVESIPATALAQELQRNAQILVQQPKSAGLHFGVGLMYARIGDFQSSVTVLKRALKLSRDNEIILGALAFIHANQMGDHRGALKYLVKKAKIDRRDATTQLLMANSHMNLGQLDKALLAIERARPLVSKAMLPKVLAMKSQCHQRMGDFDLAKDALTELGNVDPLGVVSVADTLSRMPNMDASELGKLETEMVAALGEGSGRFRDELHQAMTANALAELHEKRDEFSEAFDWYSKANGLQPRDANAWGFQETKEFELLHKVFDKKLLQNLPKGHETDRQIFVVGMPRSGTTLLESILAAHAGVEDHGELSFFHEQLYRLGFTAQQNPDVTKQAGIVRRLLSSAPASGFKDIANAYLQRHGFDSDPKTFRIDKMPHNFRALGIICAAFPNAKIVHARRHPMDTCLSNFTNLLPGYNTTFGQSLETIGEFYLEYASLMRHWKAVLPNEIHEVRYEELVADTPLHAQALVEFCGIKWDENSLANRSAKRDANTASMWQVRKDVYSTSVQKWQRYEPHLGPLKDILSEEIERYEAGQ